jgi:glycosyltransferase involved in cell wall biosynthesis
MRILHILNGVEVVGNGIVNVAVDLACLQADAGHEVWVVSSGGGFETLLGHHGVVHVRLDQGRTIRKLPLAVLGFRRLVAEVRPEVVHAHMMTGAVIAWLVRRLAQYRLVCSVHTEFKRSAILMGLGDRVVGVSGAVTQSMRRRGVPARKLRTVLNGSVGSPRVRAEEGEAANLERPAIVTVAGMYRRKGIQDLIEAFGRVADDHPTAHLYLVGAGPDRPAFEAQAMALSASARVHFEGYVTNPYRYLRSADLFVLASHREPISLVISEARAAGCPIIASDADGIPEALDGGKAGVLFPAGDVGALTRSINGLLGDPELRQRWREAAGEGLEHYRAERVLSEMLAVYGD